MIERLYRAAAILMLLLPNVSDAQLHCEPPTYARWREVLLFADSGAIRHYPLDGRTRKVLFIFYHKRAFVFIFDWPEKPGVREPGAWHGCGLYRRADHQM